MMIKIALMTNGIDFVSIKMQIISAGIMYSAPLANYNKGDFIRKVERRTKILDT